MASVVGQLEDQLGNDNLLAIILLREILNSILFIWTHVLSSASFCVTAATI